MFDQAGTRDWLQLLHGGAPGLVHICATNAWHGQTFPTDPAGLDDATRFVAALDGEGREGIYARVTTLKGPLAPGRRGGAADTLAVPALWADVDLAGPGHEATPLPLPPDEAAAVAIIDAAHLPDPTLWIHSGGGLYPIWQLDTPHVVDDDRQDVADLSAGWQRAIGEAAKKLGWHYGTGVGDLARVLRIPGTINRKAGLARPCHITDIGTGRQYPLADLYTAVADALAAAESHSFTACDTRDCPDHRPRPEPRPTGVGRPLGVVTPGDDFEAGNDWSTILEPHGWTLAYVHGGVGYWRRPGKRGPGVSATTNALGTDRLRIFTTSTEFECRSYGKLGAYAVLECGGDLTAAARALRDLGYGTPPTTYDRATFADGLIAPAPAESPMDPAPDAPDALALAAEARYAADVAAETRRVRITREARRRVDQEEHEQTWREPPSTWNLTDELAKPDETITYRVEELLPAHGNAVIVAQYKAGKTTLCTSLVRSLADGEPFLNRFDVNPPDGRIAIFNYEVNEAQHRAWLRNSGIVNTDRVCVLNARGFQLTPTVPKIEDWLVRWLAQRKVSTWIVDPFARAFVGCGDENSNSDVGVFLDALDVIKERAGVSELIMPVHTGRGEQNTGQERARGATRLDDWADVRWLLTVDEQRRRYFRASGRDVDVDEESLAFDEATRRLTLGGWDRQGMKHQDLMNDVVAFVRDNPGLGVNEIILGIAKGRTRAVRALQDAIAHRLVYSREATNRKRLHYVAGHLPSAVEEAE
jgi:AAA domain